MECCLDVPLSSPDIGFVSFLSTRNRSATKSAVKDRNKKLEILLSFFPVSGFYSLVAARPWHCAGRREIPLFRNQLSKRDSIKGCEKLPTNTQFRFLLNWKIGLLKGSSKSVEI
ncbi:hypothetical protein AVEN_132767-1 [Araneus ventricosus]|uniref:Uncharacterized protein n=1 Tax=Araneus ventricosus TaxID=182803 RepID=A0A4Y2W6A8_ARAVE|nr:hypothetical protein AVEN_224238-1 [Araneus ventricosus]GBO32078.1 hypothetical protein AVEN_132767-1 [Araneus ventricosus]